MKLFGTFNISLNVAVILRFVLFAVAGVTPVLAAIFWDLQALWALVPALSLLGAWHVSTVISKSNTK